MSNNQMISTAADRVRSLSNSIAQGLEVGQRYVALLNQLTSTKDPKELLAATEKLEGLSLENAFVKFPQHYQLADYYLLLMARMLELNNESGLTIEENDIHHQLLAKISPMEDQERFTFEIDPRNGGAFFAEQHHHEPLFYLNLKHQILKFSNRALVDFFIVRQTQKFSDLDLQAVVQPMIKFALLLEKQLDFVIDLGILETGNGARFRLQKPDLPLTIIDRLFVKTTDTDYMLLSLPQNNGAELRLDQNVRLQLAFDPDDYSQEWSFRVLDSEERVSFFDVLLHYPLVREWYLDNREFLAVRTDAMIFAADEPENLTMTTPDQPASQIEQPTADLAETKEAEEKED